MAKKSIDLVKAKIDKKDEFYTCYADIEIEMKAYTQALKGKVVYCNCDDYRRSNFVKFFKDNFHKFKLKHLYASNIDNGEGGYSYSYDGVNEVVTMLNDGSFDSEECVEILRLSAVIITNPPFSLFRKFMDLIFEHDKHLIVIGNQNAITYNNVFNSIMQNRLRVERGGFKATVGYFYSPYDTYDGMGVKKDNCMRVNGVCWFSSVAVGRSTRTAAFTKTYSKKAYQKFDDTEIINVPTVKDIPQDYTGLMGVPITYLYAHDSEEYELLGKASSNSYVGEKCYEFNTVLKGVNKYHRLLIQKV